MSPTPYYFDDDETRAFLLEAEKLPCYRYDHRRIEDGQNVSWNEWMLVTCLKTVKVLIDQQDLHIAAENEYLGRAEFTAIYRQYVGRYLSKLCVSIERI
jgi:hypothetical protein